MTLLKALIGSAIGGAIGAGVWAAVAYNMDRQTSWVAILVGLLCGLGASVFARGYADNTTGAVAGLVALLSVCTGKYLAVHYILADMTKGMNHVELTEADAQMYMADQLTEEYAGSGTPLQWSEGMSAEDAESLDDYPDVLKKDVLVRWEGMSTGERESYRVSVQATMNHELSSALREVEAEGFFATFSPLDIVFFLLAIGGAYKVGSGDISMGGDND